MACAAASAPLFLSSSGSASLQLQLAAQCPDAAYPVVQQSGFARGFTRPADVSERAPEAILAQGLPRPSRLVSVIGGSAIRSDAGSTAVSLMFRDGAPENVAVLSRVDGDGLLLPETTADYLGVRAGDRVQVGGADELGNPVLFPVVGVYRDLFREDGVRPFWCSYTSLFLNLASLGAPPPLVLATSVDLAERIGDTGATQGMARSWIVPIDTDRLTLTTSRAIVTARERAFAASGIANAVGGEGETGQLPRMLERSQLLVAGLRGPVVPVAAGGAILALLLVAAAGSYWVDRRAAEIRLLTSRGVTPGALGVKALLELALPAAVGTVLGWLGARWLVTVLGPSPYLDAGVEQRAGLAAAVCLIAGLILLTTIAVLRTRPGERSTTGRRPWYAVLPWEALAVAAGVVGYLQLRSGPAVQLEGNVAQVDILLVAAPLIFLTGAAVAAGRGLGAVLPSLRSRSRNWTPALFVGVARMCSARWVSALVLVAMAVPVSVLAYSAGVTTTTQVSLETKARVVVGSDRALISVDPIEPSPSLDAVGTVVIRYSRAQVDGEDVTVLAVDTDTVTRWAFWDQSFADTSFDTVIRTLDRPTPGAVSAIAWGMPEGRATVQLASTALGISVVDTVETFPGRRQPDPLIVVDASALEPVDPLAGPVSEVWTRRSTADVRAALPAEVRIGRVLERDTVFDVANFRSVSWTFDYLQALAVLIGAVGLGGLLLYVETRQRRRVASYAMSRRMGMTAGTHVRALLVELGGLLVVAALVGAALGWAVVLAVYRFVELDPLRPPGPLLSVPTTAFAAAGAGTVAVVALVIAYAHRTAARADVSRVLRLE